MNAIQLLQEARSRRKLGVFNYMDDKDTLKMIAQQAQDIYNNGDKFNESPSIAYKSAVNQFGEPLVRAAIELYNNNLI